MINLINFNYMNYQHYERIINPLKIEPCKLLTTRKKQFYTQTYDPIKIIQNNVLEGPG